MNIQSMTGFGRADGSRADWRWHWELKTVNARGLDIRMRMPNGLEPLEQGLKKSLQAKLKRGAVQVFINIERENAGADVRVNAALAAKLMADLKELATGLGTQPPTLDAVLGIRGVVEVAEPDTDEDETAARLAAVAATFDEAVESLVSARTDEGAKLQTILESVLTEIAQLVARADALAVVAPEAIRSRLEAQVTELLADRAEMPEERIIQEVAMLAGKADIREELDRLRAHIAQARTLLAEGISVGRKLDFLAQEFNREANTLCSKSSDTELTRIGLDLKAAIEQLREQVQNVE
ncbi:Protein YicC [Candidatus Phaeomarinobacter ectocarpi]|uniref:Protein YicC n=2 Tax=Candidatus Phaeomarinibacter ectocarpi TaxID=1458461 RepID=X5MP40_9HYPH|nr:Protein YicC [Candidatus Phaeomarinobacter ectocarpi]